MATSSVYSSVGRPLASCGLRVNCGWIAGRFFRDPGELSRAVDKAVGSVERAARRIAAGEISGREKMATREGSGEKEVFCRADRAPMTHPWQPRDSPGVPMCVQR